MINDVCPTPGEEQAQSGSGSVNLEWHTEDGFHPYRCDYLGLMCLRNPQRIATTYADIRSVRLEPAVAAVLAEERFIIRPDDEHLRSLRGTGGMAGNGGQLRLWRDPAPVAVLFGDPAHPYLRIDPHFMGVVPGDTVAAGALETLIGALDGCLANLVLTPGDIAFLDNYRVVHGRRPFTPSYRGDDRWLKKILVTRDIRKSRALRATERSVVLGQASPVPTR
jgi:Fe(II)/alpha-ketoglutarate-dependent arginine beta-hydroxylase